MIAARQLRRFARRGTAALCTVAVAAVSSAATANASAAPAAPEPTVARYLADTGPLRIRDQFALGLAFLSLDPVPADLVAVGTWQVDFALSTSNTFALSPETEAELEGRDRQPLNREELRSLAASTTAGSYLIDAEHVRAALALRYGIARRWQLEISVPLIDFDGGSLDSAIEGFHDTFSLGQAGRLGTPRDAFLLYVGAQGRELYRDRAPGTALGDISVGAKVDLLPTGHALPFQLALEAVAKLPTGSESRLTGSGALDFGAQLVLTRYFARSCLHASVGAVYLGSSEILDLGGQLRFSAMAAFERAVGSKSSLIAQVTLSESPFEDLALGELEEFSTLVTAGLKTVAGRQVVFFGITENILNFNNSPDIGLHFGVTRTF